MIVTLRLEQVHIQQSLRRNLLGCHNLVCGTVAAVRVGVSYAEFLLHRLARRDAPIQL